MTRPAIIGASWNRAFIPSLTLCFASSIFWLPHSSWGSLAAAGSLALLGGLAGRRLAAGDLRSWLVLAAAAALSAVALVSTDLVFRLPLAWLGAETAAAAHDAAVVGIVSAAIALAAAFVSARVPAARPLPAALLVAAVASLLGAHRGGAIHRPHFLSDPAWLHGWHPGFVLAGCGAVAGLAATLALIRLDRSHRVTLQLALLLLMGAVLIALAPGVGLLGFSSVDPLGLSNDSAGDFWRTAAEGSDKPMEYEQDAAGDSLGLTERAGKDGVNPEQMVPFLDEYTQNGTRTPVAVVILHEDVEPFGGVLYFRQVSFSSWNGRRLVRSFDPRVDQDLFRGFPLVDPIEVPAPHGKDLRLVVPTTVSLMRDHAQPPVLVDGIRIEPRPVVDPSIFSRTYHARSEVLVAKPQLLLGRGSTTPDWPEDVRAKYLELPDDPRYGSTARAGLELLRPEYRDSPWARALSVSLWLESNTKYSLRSKHAAATDPTASFLFGDRIGYCVHLAHAAAFMLRALDLPSRVSAGYAYQERDRAGGSAILLRAGDAHAWAEVFLDGVGWVPIDPSPPSLDPPMLAPDLDLQRLLGELARGDEENRAAVSPRPWRAGDLRKGLLLAFGAALLLWSLTGHAVKLYRRLLPLVSTRDPRARSAYRASLDRLADAGVFRRFGETREAFAGRVRALSPAFEALTSVHLAACFGGLPSDPRRSRALSSEIAHQIAERGGRRRTFGLISPWRWTRAR